jgi:hypothetical protein
VDEVDGDLNVETRQCLVSVGKFLQQLSSVSQKKRTREGCYSSRKSDNLYIEQSPSQLSQIAHLVLQRSVRMIACAPSSTTKIPQPVDDAIHPAHCRFGAAPWIEFLISQQREPVTKGSDCERENEVQRIAELVNRYLTPPNTSALVAAVFTSAAIFSSISSASTPDIVFHNYAFVPSL